MSRTALATLACLLLLAPAVAGGLLPTQAGEVLVGFNGPIDTTLITLLGGTVLATLPEINTAQVWTADVAGFIAAALLHGVAFAEPNGPTRIAASSWDASSWDASSWDASSWDASSWDASSWDASSWDASSWDASSWDASTWTATSWGKGAKRDPGYASQWGLGAANFIDAWRTTRGASTVSVCMLDTGIEASHPDLAANVWKSKSGVAGHDARLNPTGPADDVGHGTHVAGILAAVQANGLGVTGAAREKVQAVKVMGPTGGTEADLARGLVWCGKNGARIASMSLHIDAPSPTVERAVNYARGRGLLIIAAAGNDGGDVRYPAAYAGVLAVGAVTPSGEAAGFSNRGAALDIVAPGWKIVSTMTGGKYASGSGTSAAVPFVAAAAALAWEVNPRLTNSGVETALKTSARDFGAAGNDPIYGAGALNAGAAVAMAKQG